MAYFTFELSGAAGEGIKVAGLILAETAFRSGLYVHGYTEYPSLIRGGVNTFRVTADKLPVFACSSQLDLQIDLQATEIPLTQLCSQVKAPVQARNLVALGAACYRLGLDLKNLNLAIKANFSKKGAQVIKLNQAAAQSGYVWAKKNQPPLKQLSEGLKPLKGQILENGNEALALGSIAGGMKFYTAYPMTPVTAMLHFLAAKAEEYQLLVHQAEDEIGVINLALGASFCGVRSLVATAGGGFSLMTEALGLSGVSETPLVIILGMRPGPASGMPTWSSQGDLLFSINASQDEFPRIVLAPGDPQEAFALAKLGQNLAEKYQLPVIILSDKNLGESFYTCPGHPKIHFNQRYSFKNTPKRYQLTANGISPRSLPGQLGGVHLANSYEHDQLGFSTESSQTRKQQVDKRARKIVSILKDKNMISPQVYGPKKTALTLISWGSNKGPILEALKDLPQLNLIHLSWLWPFPTQQFKNLVNSCSKLVLIEANSTGQLGRLIREQTGIEIKNKLLKYDGRPFFPEEIIEYVKKL